jgi:hypothetical protein
LKPPVDVEIKALGSRLLVEDHERIESARRRIIAGEAPNLETFFLSHKYGRPKDVDHAPDRPPIVFISAHGQPGDFDPLAGPQVKDQKAVAPALSLAAGPAQELEPDPDDPDALVVVR